MAGRRRKVVTATPAAPAPAPPVQVWRRPQRVSCPRCGREGCERNGSQYDPETKVLIVVYFRCRSCTTDDGNATTFKLPVERSP